MGVNRLVKDTDFKRKSENLSYWLSELLGSVCDSYIGDSVSINRDVFLKCIIEIHRDIIHMREYARANGNEDGKC
jgi:hypothetical protein